MLRVHHSGAIGDIIYSLPYLRTLKTDIIFYVGEQSATSGIGRTPKTAEDIAFLNMLFPKSAYIVDPTHTIYQSIARLLLSQDYIQEVHPANEAITPFDINLDDFRRSWSSNNHIADGVLQHFGVPSQWKNKPFIDNIPVCAEYFNTCVCARSPRYRNANGDFLWSVAVSSMKQRVKNFVFVGIEKEYEDFCTTIPDFEIEYVKIADLYDMAIIINSCQVGIYNGSSPLAIACGLNKGRIIEAPNPLACKSTIHTGSEVEFFLD